MAKVPTVFFICGNGLGSSLACQMEADDVFSEAGIEVNSDHDSISDAPSLNADVIVSASNFESQFANMQIDPKTKFVYLDNIVDKDEIKEKVLPVVKQIADS
ncbi:MULTISPECIES: PTS sugar transporter subunit IIB [Lactobacillus]|uniref:PTS sugar transporter subunit IIB n=1 Tax=Lactobacillus TaxID=1578 RepID=UPI000512A7DB|nr:MULTISPECIES: PTS sugar transporter subunit IIB [Lactobacillus]KGG53511.1 putative sugar phosphotransferase component II B [Lactobacillus sp. wkB10]MBI0121143.1 PTS sugar transporter subunit IIB [Lactobacillus sp. M0398]MBI0123290.1 PTS sugar transporter subunit IIB [Lactobacillus sp. W8174]MBI0135645.1 PTS sugar transporter subunit IIB [Lactobacillus sp. W8173]MCX0291680.1 PTS sugar transporter subunit IIB [Lactobacillus kullabergensis]